MSIEDAVDEGVAATLELAAVECDKERDSGWTRTSPQYLMADLLGKRIRAMKPKKLWTKLP